MDRDRTKCKHFIVVKDFWKIGCACMGFFDDEDILFRSTLSKCLLIAKPPLQVIRLDGHDNSVLDVYGEYKPYNHCNDVQELLDICISGNAPGMDNPLVLKNPALRDEFGPGK